MSDAKKRYDALDGMRGVAAIAVMIYHFIQHGAFAKRFHLLGSAYLAVDLFFMLSGFVLAHSYMQLLLSNSLSARDFLIKRIIRLYPMYFMGAMIGTPVLLLMIAMKDSTLSYVAAIDSSLNSLAFLPFLHFSAIRNIGGEGSGVGEVFPANPPAWSLFFELGVSYIFLFFVGLERHRLRWICTISYVALVVNGCYLSLSANRIGVDLEQGWGVLNFLGGFPRVLFGVTIGILVYDAAKQHQNRFPKIPNSYVLYIIVLMVLLFPFGIKGIYPMVVLAAVAPGLVLLGSQIEIQGSREILVAKYLGWLSYPVYCLHFPIGRAVFEIGGRYPVSWEWLAAISATSTVVLSVVLTKLIEEPVRSYFTEKMRVARRSPAREFAGG